ncbi:ECF-type riboflavin transporter substrate-binding protein [Evansella tamaricis]|uniref:UPF0397 protein KS419_13315 n=1 Tax=Evansella tamaricis TaxID=2069301 RepID=A0ABS6JGC9_9BACI|nr:ECF-type riboflavin transporter substrate-binding protein [Evansella tamaricis]MBU9712724.1 ECF-type riboflavin transporter substrate-binding protein [Evansella tamaricis]
MNGKLATKTIVAIGIGVAVFVILNRFAAIPTGVPNTNFQVSYAFLALMAVVYGPIAGALIGFVGHALTDAIVWGSVWWSWVVVSGFVGLAIGLVAKKIDIENGVFGLKEIITFNVTQVVVNAIGWMLIAPSLDILIYVEPENKVYVQGAVAGGFNILTVGVIGTLLLIAYAKTRSKSGSLDAEA